MGKTCDPGRDRLCDAKETVECVDRRFLANDDDEERWQDGRFTVLSVTRGCNEVRCVGLCSCSEGGELGVIVVVVVIDA